MDAQSNMHDDSALFRAARGAVARCRSRGYTLVTAESCTGGWIAKCLTDIAGSSDWYRGGVVSYSNGLKTQLLGVEPHLLNTHGAVSEAVARAMAKGALEHLGGDYAVAVTGIAGPAGGTPEKPVGTVWIAWADCSDGTFVQLFQFPGDREAVRRATVLHALQGLLRDD